MRKQNTSSVKAHLVRGAFYLALLSAGTLLGFFRPETPANSSQRTLTFAERVVYQRAIEDVYWRHRIWPKENPDPKPSLDAVISQAQLEKKVEDYLLKSQALEDHWQRPITTEQLQAEMDRMAHHTKQPEVLRELFAALRNDPFIIAECLARPVLSDRLVTDLSAHDQEPLTSWRTIAENHMPKLTAAASAAYTLPNISDGAGCTGDTWTDISTVNAPSARAFHTAVWTGSEMIVWGGVNNSGVLNTGGRYNPSTDTWTATSITNQTPDGRYYHTAVWTGSEMIIWGGLDGNVNVGNTGGIYNPIFDSWAATSTFNAPDPRWFHTAVWTGSEMIIWGGYFFGGVIYNDGARLSSGNSWTAMSLFFAPTRRYGHTAVWTGSEMIIWGATGDSTGGRYNPSTDSWAATSTTNAPTASNHTAVWTGSEMIIWGGYNSPNILNTGGRYDPGTDSWTATTTTNAPQARLFHTAVWTDSEMIVWGGCVGGNPCSNFVDTGGIYDPGTDSWTATSATNAPLARAYHTAVWTGSEMIVWGGQDDSGNNLNTGGRYCAQSASPTPTPTATATATPTPSSAPCSVSGINPPCGSTVNARLADFVVYVSDPVDPATVQSSDLMCNGIPASAVAYTPGSTTISFHFGNPPLNQGLNTMHVPAGAFNCVNGQPVVEFTCTLTGYSPREISPRPRPSPAPRPTP